MEISPEYDVAIVGGGLAGLAAGIQLCKAGHRVIVFEKESYPYHKVCGEYISLESWDFLCSLGLPLAEWNLPVLDTLRLTAPNGRSFQIALPLGGFGVSRYRLDSELASIAKKAGVHLLEKTKVDDIKEGERFTVHFNQQSIVAKVCLAAYGKRSNLDVKWKRSFLQQTDRRLNNFVGIKYHVKTDWPSTVIGLHNFEDGYCGISKIEDDRYCLCYMTRAENLKKNGNSIEAMQETILFQNPHLRSLFRSSEILPTFPLAISQISFSAKPKVEDGVLMLGDAAGMITPLCGNGMSIALHTGKMAATLAGEFLNGRLAKAELEKEYTRQWQRQFAARLRTGRTLQQFFGSSRVSNLFVATIARLPFLAKPVIRLTHGEPF